MAACASVWAVVEVPELVAGLVLVVPFVRGKTPRHMKLLYSEIQDFPQRVWSDSERIAENKALHQDYLPTVTLINEVREKKEWRHRRGWRKGGWKA